MKKIREEWMNNRELSRSPKKRQTYCDIGLGIIGGPKCKLCHRRIGRRRNKK